MTDEAAAPPPVASSRTPLPGRVRQPWRRLPPDALDRLERLLAASPPAMLFFRADDVGVPSARFARLIALFIRQEAPLALAVVPSWLTAARWAAIQPLLAPRPDLWTLHQHGRRHVNHEPVLPPASSRANDRPAPTSPAPTGPDVAARPGRPCEFGPARSAQALRADLALGRRRLEGLLGPAFTPIFTPPWNRLDAAALAAVQDLGFAAVSRSLAAKPAAPAGLPDIPVGADLHTRKEPTAEAALTGFLSELSAGLAAGLCGVMIHHQRMNEAAFTFLEALLTSARAQSRLRFVSLRRLAEDGR